MHSTANKMHVSQFICFCKVLYMFQMVFLTIIRSSKVHIQHQVFVRPILLPARLAAGSSNGLTYLMLYVQFWAPDDGWKNRLKHVERLTEINQLWNVAPCWLYSANFFHPFTQSSVEALFFSHSINSNFFRSVYNCQ